MAADNVTVADSGLEFETDTTQYTASLQTPGGKVKNTHGSVATYINVDAGTVDTAQPVAGSGRMLAAGDEIQLPHTCHSFTFKTAAGSGLLLVTKN